MKNHSNVQTDTIVLLCFINDKQVVNSHDTSQEDVQHLLICVLIHVKLVKQHFRNGIRKTRIIHIDQESSDAGTAK